MMNENAIANILVDLDFLEEQFRNAGRTNLNPLFTELRSVRPPAPPFILALKISFQFFFSRLCLIFIYHYPTKTTSIVLSDSVAEYLVPSLRQTTYASVKTRRLTALLEKLARYGGSCRDHASREKGERRRKEAEAVGRLFPGENR